MYAGLKFPYETVQHLKGPCDDFRPFAQLTLDPETEFYPFEVHSTWAKDIVRPWLSRCVKNRGYDLVKNAVPYV